MSCFTTEDEEAHAGETPSLRLPQAHFPQSGLLKDPTSPRRLGPFGVKTLMGLGLSLGFAVSWPRTGMEGFRVVGVIQKELEGINGSAGKC